MIFNRGILLLIIALLFISACVAKSPDAGNTANDTENATAAGVSFKRDIQPILDANCVVCHQGTNASASGGMVLASGFSYGSIVGVKSTESPLARVEPGSPDKSYIIAKLSGNQSAVGGSGARMPFGQSPLPQTQIDIIGRWISDGAKNN